MRVMAKIMLPVESGNQGVKDGTIGKLFQAAGERWKPEAMYFGTFEGPRIHRSRIDAVDGRELGHWPERRSPLPHR